VVAADRIPAPELQRLISARPALAGLDLSTPHLMGIVNVTPDSFSDGGRHFDPGVAVSAALAMVNAGASLIDIGGESTRPGAVLVPPEQEIARIVPVISALRAQSDVCISIDTRKAVVAQAAIDAGASLVNDVSGLTFDPDLAPLCSQAEVPVCVMHAQGDPTTMQKNPSYDNVLLDVFDFLERQIAGLETAGVPRSRIVVDPGIGFGKTIDHNLALLQNISIFHGLGCAILLGVSRKGFIGKLGQQPDANARAPGSIAVGLAALAQGVQILRVHDVSETAQALRLWRAVT
jgi:dihydropteroate synthase